MELIREENSHKSGDGVELPQNADLSNSIEVVPLLQGKNDGKLNGDNLQATVIDEAETSKFLKYFILLKY